MIQNFHKVSLALSIPKFEKNDLLHQFPPHYFDRGMRYFNTGKVLEVISSADSDKLVGVVRGSKEEPYYAHITIAKKGQKVVFNGQCSCPMERNCKHVVASLLRYLNDNSQRPKAQSAPRSPVKENESISPKVVKWLKSLSASEALPSTLINSKPKEVLYLLNKNDTNGEYNVLEVTAVLAKYLQNGKLSITGKNIHSIYKQSDDYHFLTSEDKAISSMLKNCKSYAKDEMNLNNDNGVELLERMIATGRCYYATTKTSPITLAEPACVDLRWQEVGDGYKAFPFAGDVEARLFFVEGFPWAYDGNKQCFSKVLYDGDITIFNACLKSPVISPLEVEQVNEALGKQKTKLPLPAIQVPKMTKVEVEPTAHLEVIYHYRQHRKTVYLMLDFIYNNTAIDWQSQKSVVFDMDEQSPVMMPRHVASEENYLAKLAKFGFEFVKNYQTNETDIKKSVLAEDFIKNTYLKLKEAGFAVHFDESFPVEDVAETIDAWYANVDKEKSDNHWFDLELGVKIGREKINLLPILKDLIQTMPGDKQAFLSDTANISYSMPDGRILILPGERIKKILGVIIDLFDKEHVVDDDLRLSSAELTRLNDIDEALEGQRVEQLDNVSARNLAEKLKDFTKIVQCKVPKNINATLRPYQVEGVSWLQFLREYQFGGILADDMGLGKTLQAITHICLEKQVNRLTKPCLVISPTSVLSNWELELKKFAPHLSVLTLHGDSRRRYFGSITEHDVILTTYPLLVRDKEVFLAEQFHMAILDEAQVIKNSKTKAAKIACQLKANNKICLTGTPLENHLGELWSIFNYVMPGLLSSLPKFTKFYRSPIEKHNDQEKKSLLLKRIAPFIIRRTKQEVAQELPPKTEIVQAIDLDETESDLYETVRLAMHAKISKEISTKGFAKSQIVILDALLKLRQICCDARLLKLDAAKSYEGPSSKLRWLEESLPEMIEEGRRIIIFSQFTQMLSLIEDVVKRLNIDFSKITGSTKDRMTPVQQFQNGDNPLFLISLKAGGTGLNLTAADTVIHYDPWWNPAVEAQATDRVHRIGQDKPVFVYKLIAQNSVEEKILAMQEKKAKILEAVLATDSTKKTKLTNKDVESLFL